MGLHPSSRILLGRVFSTFTSFCGIGVFRGSEDGNTRVAGRLSDQPLSNDELLSLQVREKRFRFADKAEEPWIRGRRNACDPFSILEYGLHPVDK
jgi:hypothetical protein